MRKYYQIRIFSIITLLAFVFTQTAWSNESRGVFVSAKNSHMRPIEPSQAEGVSDEIANELQVGAKAPGKENIANAGGKFLNQIKLAFEQKRISPYAITLPLSIILHVVVIGGLYIKDNNHINPKAEYADTVKLSPDSASGDESVVNIEMIEDSGFGAGFDVVPIIAADDLLVTDVPANEDYQMTHIDSTSIYHLNFPDYQKSSKLMERLGVFSEHDEYKGQVLDNDQLDELMIQGEDMSKSDFGSRRVFSGYNIRFETVADFYNEAKKKNIELNETEQRLKNELLDNGLIVYKNGRYYAMRRGYLIGTISGFALDPFVISHEIGHGLYETDPEYRKAVDQWWADLQRTDPKTRRLLELILRYFDYDETTMPTEAAEYLSSLTQLKFLINKINQSHSDFFQTSFAVSEDKARLADEIARELIRYEDISQNPEPGDYLNRRFVNTVNRASAKINKAKKEAFKRNNINAPEFFDKTAKLDPLILRDAQPPMKMEFKEIKRLGVSQIQRKVDSIFSGISSYDANLYAEKALELLNSQKMGKEDSFTVTKIVNLGGERFELQITVGSVTSVDNGATTRYWSSMIQIKKPGREYDYNMDLSAHGSSRTRAAEAFQEAWDELKNLAPGRAIDLRPQSTFKVKTFEEGLKNINILIASFQAKDNQDGYVSSHEEFYININLAGESYYLHFIQHFSGNTFETRLGLEQNGKVVHDLYGIGSSDGRVQSYTQAVQALNKRLKAKYLISAANSLNYYADLHENGVYGQEDYESSEQIGQSRNTAKKLTKIAEEIASSEFNEQAQGIYARIDMLNSNINSVTNQIQMITRAEGQIPAAKSKISGLNKQIDGLRKELNIQVVRLARMHEFAMAPFANAGATGEESVANLTDRFIKESSRQLFRAFQSDDPRGNLKQAIHEIIQKSKSYRDSDKALFIISKITFDFLCKTEYEKRRFASIVGQIIIDSSNKLNVNPISEKPAEPTVPGVVWTLTTAPIVSVGVKNIFGDWSNPNNVSVDLIGGGLNVSLGLAERGVKTRPVFFYAGQAGQLLLKKVEMEGLVTGDAIELNEPEETRVNIKISSSEGGIGLTSPRTPANEHDMAKLLQKMDEVQNGDIVVISGSPTSGLPETFYAELGKRLMARGATVMIDTRAEPAKQVLLQGAATVYIQNQYDFGIIFKIDPLDFDGLIRKAVEIIQSQPVDGVREIIVTLGPDGAFSVTRERVLRAVAPKLNAVINEEGAGDASTVERLFRMLQGRPYIECFRYGIASGSASVQHREIGGGTAEEIERLVGQVSITEEKLSSAGATGAVANADGGLSLSPKAIADIDRLVKELVEWRQRYNPGTNSISEDVNDPGHSRLVNAAFIEYDFILKIIRKMGVKGRMLYPCIGADNLPAKYFPVLGIYYGPNQWSEIKVKERMKNALGRSFDEKIWKSNLEETKCDLRSEHEIDNLVEDLADHADGERIKSVLLKRPARYIGKASVEYLLQQLSVSCLEDGDTIVLTDNEMTDTNIKLLRDLGFEEVNLPQNIKDNIANSPAILESYFEPENEGESMDNGVIFYFVHNFTVMKKMRRTEKIPSDPHLAGKKVLIIDKDEVSAQESKKDLIERGVSSKDILPFVILPQNVIADIEAGAVTAIYEIRAQISAVTLGNQVSLVVNNITNNESAILNLKDIFHYEVIITTGSDISDKDQNKWQEIYQSL